jgi:hypothetical protein
VVDLLWIEALKVFDVPLIAYVHAVFSLELVGPWDYHTADDERSILRGG